MQIDPNAIRQLAQAIAAELGPSGQASPATTSAAPRAGASGDGVYSTIDEAVKASRRAFMMKSS